MRTVFTRCAAILTVVGLSLAGGVARSQGTEIGKRLEELDRSLGAAEVRRVEVVYLPADVLTRVRVTASWLDRNFSNKLVIADAAASKKFRRLPEVLRKIIPAESAVLPDLRWGCTFYSSEGKLMASIYLDAQGTSGLIDGQAVAMQPALLEWLRGNFLCCFE